MTAARKAFRVETMIAGSPGPAAAAAGPDRSGEILDGIAELKRLIQPQNALSQNMIEDYRRQFSEAHKLKEELDEIYLAIERTKREIATLHVSGFKGAEMTRVTDELDAVVGGTEQATEQILSAAEHIDEAAATLAARTKGTDAELAQDIQDRVLSIFEACNFQDLTGQRITKVVNVLGFIEGRVHRMMEIWGGLDNFASIEADPTIRKVGDEALLNGPALPEADGVASQDDIDALFA